MIKYILYFGEEGGLIRVLSDICIFFLDCILGVMDGKGIGVVIGVVIGVICIGCFWGGVIGLGVFLGVGVCL